MGLKSMKIISDRISYIEAVENPLSSDVGIVYGDNKTWLYDVGCSKDAANLIKNMDKNHIAVISHFHPDHMENLKFVAGEVYVSKNTYRYCNRGNIVTRDLYFEDGCDLHIFLLPSSHAKGSLGLEVDGEYAFLGDAIYPAYKNGESVYNPQILYEEIKVLKRLNASYFLLSHRRNFVQKKENVIACLEEIYAKLKC